MGKHDKGIVGLAAEHVFDLFRHAKDGSSLVFHGYNRSRDVVAAAREIAKAAKLDDEDATIVLLAAWFHDAAYAVTHDGDRHKGIELARSFLARHGASKELADSVAACIESAQNPAHDHPLHEILHDALISPLAGSLTGSLEVGGTNFATGSPGPAEPKARRARAVVRSPSIWTTSTMARRVIRYPRYWPVAG